MKYDSYRDCLHCHACVLALLDTVLVTEVGMGRNYYSSINITAEKVKRTV
jgi:hypothetical protein